MTNKLSTFLWGNLRIFWMRLMMFTNGNVWRDEMEESVGENFAQTFFQDTDQKLYWEIYILLAFSEVEHWSGQCDWWRYLWMDFSMTRWLWCLSCCSCHQWNNVWIMCYLLDLILNFNSWRSISSRSPMDHGFFLALRSFLEFKLMILRIMTLPRVLS